VQIVSAATINSFDATMAEEKKKELNHSHDISTEPSSSVVHAPQLHGVYPKAGNQEESVTFHVLYENVMIPMRDAVELAGDLFLPAINGFVDLSRKWFTKEFITLNYFSSSLAQVNHANNVTIPNISNFNDLCINPLGQ
jgi:hypothetical protein